MFRTLLEEQGRRWHIADLTGQLGLAVSNAQPTVARIERFCWLDAYDHHGDTIYQVATSRPVPANQLGRLHPDRGQRLAPAKVPARRTSIAVAGSGSTSRSVSARCSESMASVMPSRSRRCMCAAMARRWARSS